MDRRSMMSLMLGVTLCVSIWHLMLQQQQEQYYDASLPSSVVLTSSSSSLVNESAFTNLIYASTSSENMLTSSLSSNNIAAALPKNDFSQLIDLDNFEFLMNPRTCKDLEQTPIVVILVHSAPDNSQKRQTIRETWGNNRESNVWRHGAGKFQ
ncbi:hypothetical protein PVAND_008423 [Polypedilum vanderplanki]|uniref:Hexosyltransferase n=1 Tax=Polypedilum vanderplanki TaxID=319348 RepID=A0A9J6C9R0_POLVA|nr:hypothetical protein PVAND_008423 [Polypedilum vanderplanki]